MESTPDGVTYHDLLLRGWTPPLIRRYLRSTQSVRRGRQLIPAFDVSAVRDAETSLPDVGWTSDVIVRLLGRPDVVTGVGGGLRTPSFGYGRDRVRPRRSHRREADRPPRPQPHDRGRRLIGPTRTGSCPDVVRAAAISRRAGRHAPAMTAFIVGPEAD